MLKIKIIKLLSSKNTDDWNLAEELLKKPGVYEKCFEDLIHLYVFESYNTNEMWGKDKIGFKLTYHRKKFLFNLIGIFSKNYNSAKFLKIYNIWKKNHL